MQISAEFYWVCIFDHRISRHSSIFFQEFLLEYFLAHYPVILLEISLGIYPQCSVFRYWKFRFCYQKRNLTVSMSFVCTSVQWSAKHHHRHRDWTTFTVLFWACAGESTRASSRFDRREEIAYRRGGGNWRLVLMQHVLVETGRIPMSWNLPLNHSLRGLTGETCFRQQ